MNVHMEQCPLNALFNSHRCAVRYFCKIFDLGIETLRSQNVFHMTDSTTALPECEVVGTLVTSCEVVITVYFFFFGLFLT